MLSRAEALGLRRGDQGRPPIGRVALSAAENPRVPGVQEPGRRGAQNSGWRLLGPGDAQPEQVPEDHGRRTGRDGPSLPQPYLPQRIGLRPGGRVRRHSFARARQVLQPARNARYVRLPARPRQGTARARGGGAARGAGPPGRAYNSNDNDKRNITTTTTTTNTILHYFIIIACNFKARTLHSREDRETIVGR